jgi:hypothetical protein
MRIFATAFTRLIGPFHDVPLDSKALQRDRILHAVDIKQARLFFLARCSVFLYTFLAKKTKKIQCLSPQ